MEKWAVNIENKVRYDSYTGDKYVDTSYWVVPEEKKEFPVSIVCGSLLLHKEKMIKNANLIAAAPELLLACEGALNALRLSPHVDKQQAIDYLIEVIKKARGEKEG